MWEVVTASQVPSSIEELGQKMTAYPPTIQMNTIAGELKLDPLAANFFEDQSMSTNTGPPSYDV
jgi:hypothetical protein